MNSTPLDSQRPAELPVTDETSWSAWRWIASITLVFALHVGVFYFLSDRNPPPPRVVKNAASIAIAPRQSEQQQLDDPTLFALPHPRGFAAATWLRLPKITFAPFRWTEPPRLLPLPVEQLGAIFLRHAETNSPTVREIDVTAPPLTVVLAPPEIETTPRPSALRMDGALAGRPLRIAPKNIPQQPAQEGLNNTIVQVLVDARGQVISPTINPPGSGSKTADQTALTIARNLRFTPLTDSTQLTVGRLIFEWQTLPATNALAATP